MKARPLAITLSLVTAAAWIAYSLVTPKAWMTVPLLAFLPQNEWPGNPSPMLLVALPIYCIVPTIAYVRKSKGIAWIIPFTPLIGIGIFMLRFSFGMKAFN